MSIITITPGAYTPGAQSSLDALAEIDVYAGDDDIPAFFLER